MLKKIISVRGILTRLLLLSVAAAASGLLISIMAATPVGATVVVTELACFLTFSLIGKFLKRS